MVSPSRRLTLSSRNVFPFFPDPPVGFFCFFATAGALGPNEPAMIDCEGRKEMLRAIITNLPTNFPSAITADASVALTQSEPLVKGDAIYSQLRAAILDSYERIAKLGPPDKAPNKTLARDHIKTALTSMLALSTVKGRVITVHIWPWSPDEVRKGQCPDAFKAGAGAAVKACWSMHAEFIPELKSHMDRSRAQQQQPDIPLDIAARNDLGVFDIWWVHRRNQHTRKCSISECHA